MVFWLSVCLVNQVNKESGATSVIHTFVHFPLCECWKYPSGTHSEWWSSDSGLPRAHAEQAPRQLLNARGLGRVLKQRGVNYSGKLSIEEKRHLYFRPTANTRVAQNPSGEALLHVKSSLSYVHVGRAPRQLLNAQGLGLTKAECLIYEEPTTWGH